MGNNNGGSKVWFYFLIFILFVCVLLFLYFAYRRYVNTTQDNYKTIEEQGKTIDDLESDLKKALDSARKERIVEWGKYVLVLGTVCFLAYLFYKYKTMRANDFLTIDEAKAKGKIWMKEFYGVEPLWCQAHSTERREGDSKLYFLVFGWTEKMQGQPIPWGATKIFAVMNDDWEHARIETIPQGYTMLEAVDYILSELDNKGYPVVRSKTLNELATLDNILQQKKADEKLYADLGFKNNEGGM